MKQKRWDNKGSALIAFLGFLIALLVLAVVIFSITLFKKSKQDKEEPTTRATITDEPTSTDVASETEASSEKEKTGLEGYVIPDLHDTDQTIHIPEAELVPISQAGMDAEDQEAAESQNKDKVQDGETTEEMMVYLPYIMDNPIEGSYNQQHDPVANGESVQKTKTLASRYMVLMDCENGEVIAERSSDVVVPPASMTKILTLLTAMDYVDESKLDDTFEITQDILDICDERDASCVGFQVGDKPTVKDLLYGTILPSGGDAALGLAKYCCGSEEAFVEKMNEKVDALGLSETAHFTNVIGLYDDNLHCTVRDMCIILAVAVQNPLARDVLSLHTYTTTPTASETDGIEVSNWFLRRIEDKECNGTVVCAKTGFVDQSGCCAASYFESNSGKKYVCVTVNSISSWRTIYDHVGIYRSYTK